MRGLWTPKQQSSSVQNLVAQLNSILKGNYFVLILKDAPLRYGRYYYVLELTALGYKKNKRLEYLQVFSDEKFSFDDMYIYLMGIINGLKMNEILNNNN